MKKLILFLVLGIFLINFVWAECQVATPRYGVVQCVDVGEEYTSLTLSTTDDYSYGKYVCPTSCQLSNLPVLDCSWGTTGHWEVRKDGQLLYEKSSDGSDTGSLPIGFGLGSSLEITGYCRNWAFQKTPVPSGSNSISIQQRKYMLKEGWAGSLPDVLITGSEGCILNKNYDTTDISSYLNPTTGAIESKPSSTYSSLNQFPTNWKLGDKYIFVKDWQTGIADISLTYDKNNKGYWCGGQYGSRKIYSVQEITTITGKCYSIPQSIYLSNVECCFPSDCISKGAEYTCNPDNWKCEKTKPCNSQLDCDQTFGEGVCQNSQINQWVCDLTKRWGDYSGTCIHSAKQVSDCPSDCSSKEYYNEEQGKCLQRTNLQIEEADSSSGITGAAIGGGNKSKWIILAVIIIVIAGGLGFYFFNKNKSHSSSPVTSGKKCASCNSINDEDKKFCTNCGKKL